MRHLQLQQSEPKIRSVQRLETGRRISNNFKNLAKLSRTHSLRSGYKVKTEQLGNAQSQICLDLKEQRTGAISDSDVDLGSLYHSSGYHWQFSRAGFQLLL